MSVLIMSVQQITVILPMLQYYTTLYEMSLMQVRFSEVARAHNFQIGKISAKANH